MDRRVLIISIDGLRPDLMLLADTPHIRGLLIRGSYTCWARTTEMGKTLPSHVSMLTGREVLYHGVHWNGSKPPEGVEYQHPQVPTLFELARERGCTTALVAGKPKFRALARPGAVDFLSVPEESNMTDAETAAAAVALVREHQPRVMMFHLASVDSVSHRSGWGSPECLAAIAEADRCVGEVLDALRELDLLEQTLIILSADHGGFGRTHHGGDPRGLHIPWIIAGPNVRPGYDLTRHRDLIVRTYDTFATACDHLGIDLPRDTDGRVVAEAFQESADGVVVND